MHTKTVYFGIALVIVGVGAYSYASLSGPASFTALIPALLGAVIGICGVIARHERTRRHAMHVAVAVAVLGFLGSCGGLAKLPILLTGGDVARPIAVVVQSITAVVLAAFIALSVRSFIAARRGRAAAAS